MPWTKWDGTKCCDECPTVPCKCKGCQFYWSAYWTWSTGTSGYWNVYLDYSMEQGKCISDCITDADWIPDVSDPCLYHRAMCGDACGIDDDCWATTPPDPGVPFFGEAPPDCLPGYCQLQLHWRWTWTDCSTGSWQLDYGYSYPDCDYTRVCTDQTPGTYSNIIQSGCDLTATYCVGYPCANSYECNVYDPGVPPRTVPPTEEECPCPKCAQDYVATWVWDTCSEGPYLDEPASWTGHWEIEPYSTPYCWQCVAGAEEWYGSGCTYYTRVCGSTYCDDPINDCAEGLPEPPEPEFTNQQLYDDSCLCYRCRYDYSITYDTTNQAWPDPTTTPHCSACQSNDPGFPWKESGPTLGLCNWTAEMCSDDQCTGQVDPDEECTDPPTPDPVTPVFVSDSGEYGPGYPEGQIFGDCYMCICRTLWNRAYIGAPWVQVNPLNVQCYPWFHRGNTGPGWFLTSTNQLQAMWEGVSGYRCKYGCPDANTICTDPGYPPF